MFVKFLRLVSLVRPYLFLLSIYLLSAIVFDIMKGNTLDAKRLCHNIVKDLSLLLDIAGISFISPSQRRRRTTLVVCFNTLVWRLITI